MVIVKLWFIFMSDTCSLFFILFYIHVYPLYALPPASYAAESIGLICVCL